MSHTWKVFVAILLCTVGVAATTGPAGADSISIPFVTPQNDFSSGGLLSNLPGPYGEIRVTLIDSTDASITFAGRTVGSNVYLLNFRQEFIFPNSTLYSATDFVTTNAGTGFLHGGPFETQGGAWPVGLSIINDAFDLHLPEVEFRTAFDSLTFTLHSFSTEWTTASDVLRFSPFLSGSPSVGYQARFVEVIVTGYPANFANGRILDGFALPPQGTPFIPNSDTLLLLAGGFFLSLALGRKLVTLPGQ